jgi:hypothetical protein
MKSDVNAAALKAAELEAAALKAAIGAQLRTVQEDETNAREKIRATAMRDKREFLATAEQAWAQLSALDQLTGGTRASERRIRGALQNAERAAHLTDLDIPYLLAIGEPLARARIVTAEGSTFRTKLLAPFAVFQKALPWRALVGNGEASARRSVQDTEVAERVVLSNTVALASVVAAEMQARASIATDALSTSLREIAWPFAKGHSGAVVVFARFRALAERAATERAAVARAEAAAREGIAVAAASRMADAEIYRGRAPIEANEHALRRRLERAAVYSATVAAFCAIVRAERLAWGRLLFAPAPGTPAVTFS